MQVDKAVLERLSLDASSTRLASAGGGGCSSASTAKIISKVSEGKEKTYFMKTGTGEKARIMFEGEHTSLSAIHDAVPSLCPQSYGHGRFAAEPFQYFLVTNFLNLSGRGSPSSTAKNIPSLATKLAKLHSTPAPTPDGYSKPVFGFPVPTCCGDTQQDNSYKESWADFYANNRLRFILGESEENNGTDKELHDIVEVTASQLVPRLLGDKHLNNGKAVIPVVVHGDLWSGNVGRGRIGDDGIVQDITYDSSACYAHNEYELGIMKMFGGFGRAFLDEYHELCPRAEPVEEYEDRVSLYELYHHLNHHAMFGGGYRSGAINIMKKLLHKYKLSSGSDPFL